MCLKREGDGTDLLKSEPKNKAVPAIVMYSHICMLREQTNTMRARIAQENGVYKRKTEWGGRKRNEMI